MENAEYLFAAFIIIWAFVFAYIFFLNNRNKKLQREIELMKADKKGENNTFQSTEK